MPNEIERKELLGTCEIKDETTGEIEAIFATFGVVDRDGDIVQPDAIKDGATVVISDYGHSAIFGEKPVGKGTVSIEGNKAVVKGQLFLEMSAARDTLTVLKAMGKDQQWSWGFQVLGSEIPDEAQRKSGARRIITKTDTFETSPVVRGAGIGTRTVSAKAAETAEEKATREANELKVRQEAEEKAAIERKARELVAANESADKLFQKFQRTMRKLAK